MYMYVAAMFRVVLGIYPVERFRLPTLCSVNVLRFPVANWLQSLLLLRCFPGIFPRMIARRRLRWAEAGVCVVAGEGCGHACTSCGLVRFL